MLDLQRFHFPILSKWTGPCLRLSGQIYPWSCTISKPSLYCVNSESDKVWVDYHSGLEQRTFLSATSKFWKVEEIEGALSISRGALLFYAWLLLHIEKIGLKVFWRILHHNDADEAIRHRLWKDAYFTRPVRIARSAAVERSLFWHFFTAFGGGASSSYFESTKRKFGKVDVTIMRSWLRREIQSLFTWPRPMSERDFQIPFAAATGAIFGTEKVE